MTLVADFNSSVNVPFQRMRALLSESGGGLQEGVIGATDLKVVQRGAGANQSVDVGIGAAWVQIDTGTRNGLGHVFNDATANAAVTASNATNPRIDQIILRWNDSSVGTGSGNVPTVEALTGTATAGATLDNRTGAAALPNDCLRLADILVPAASTSVVTANIRDRRPWARGAYNRLTRLAGDLTNTSATLAAMDTTNLRGRVECSGAPMRIHLQGIAVHTVAATNMVFGLLFDGVQQEATVQQQAVGAGMNNNIAATITTIPAAGSHVIDAAFATAAATMTVRASAALPFYMTIEEIVRPNANNS